MQPKPKHLSRFYAEQFQEASIVAAYVHRPSIPTPVFTILRDLMVDEPRTVLDAGCGTGAVARHLAPDVARVDAVDFSPAMIAAGRQLPGGDHARLRWLLGSMEDVALDPPYALIVASESLHWMDWPVVLPRFRELLTPNGRLAIVGRAEARQPWSAELLRLIQRYSTNRDFQPYNVVDELTRRGLFRQEGEQRTAPLPFAQSITSYVESIHSRNGFSRERMTPEAAIAFDTAVTELLTQTYPDRTVRLEITGQVVWGAPAPRQVSLPRKEG
ncbi:MAG: class I SAM-dependent methyltransferase [Thermomicrobiales bacterium]